MLYTVWWHELIQHLTTLLYIEDSFPNNFVSHVRFVVHCYCVVGSMGINYYCATESNYVTSAPLTKLYCWAPIKINSVISEGDAFECFQFWIESVFWNQVHHLDPFFVCGKRADCLMINRTILSCKVLKVVGLKALKLEPQHLSWNIYTSIWLGFPHFGLLSVSALAEHFVQPLIFK